MKIQRTKKYVAFTGTVYDTPQEAENAETAFKNDSGVSKSWVDFQSQYGFSDKAMVTVQRAMLFHALRMQRIADEAKGE